MHNAEITDVELINQYIAGNHASIEKLIKRHKGKVYGYIMKMVRNRDLANDLFQDTFFKVIHTLKAKSYNEEGKFLSWVMRIAHNLIIDHFRKEKRSMVIDNDHDEFDIFNTIKIYDESKEEQICVAQIHADVRKLIELLPEEQKEVLFMRHYADMSFKEIAEQKNISINTALGRMRYALINMRKLIETNKMIMHYE